jgi:hypothetical protein
MALKDSKRNTLVARIVLKPDRTSDYVPYRVVLEDGNINVEQQTRFEDWVEGSDLFPEYRYDDLMWSVINDLWGKILKSCDYDLDDACKWHDFEKLD